MTPSQFLVRLAEYFERRVAEIDYEGDDERDLYRKIALDCRDYAVIALG